MPCHSTVVASPRTRRSATTTFVGSPAICLITCAASRGTHARHGGSGGMSEHGADDEPIDTELLARLETALETLPRFTREVFLAHRVDDLSYADIARITGKSAK